VQRAIRRDLDLIVTTEKDSVRFPYRFESPEVPVYFLRVEIEIIDGEDQWKTFVTQICEPQPVVAPGRYYP
jgi:tetraacyldisaccharide 4'-kinase